MAAAIQGARYARLASNKIRKYGTQLAVQRRATVAGQPLTTQTLWCIPQPDGVTMAQMVAAGNTNAGNAQPHIFVFEGSADIRETVDHVVYAGWQYKINRCSTPQIAGVNVSRHAYATREKQIV